MAARWLSRPPSRSRPLTSDVVPCPADPRRARTRRRPAFLPREVSFRAADPVATGLFTVSRHTEPAAPSPPATGDQLVILPTGDVDLATAPLLEKVLVIAVEQHPRVCCDLGGIAFFSAAGVSALLVAHGRAIQVGSRFTVRRPHGIARRVLRLTGAEQMLGIDTEPDPGRRSHQVAQRPVR